MAFLCFLFVLFIAAINLYVYFSAKPYIIVSLKDVPHQKVALLLGAKVYDNGKLSDVLLDRAQTAVNLYKNRAVKKILVSGDHGQTKYDEVNALKKFLIDNEVPPEDIFLDHAGFDTYDSLYRAKNIFGMKEMIIITQNFHLPRAIFMARSLGIEAYGFPADRRKYVSVYWNYLREMVANIKAVSDIVTGAKSTFSGEKIDVTGDGRVTWD